MPNWGSAFPGRNHDRQGVGAGFLVATLCVVFLSVAAWPALVLAADDDTADDDAAADALAEQEVDDVAVIAAREESRSFLEAERAAIERERESLARLRTQVKKEIDELLALEARIDAQLKARELAQDDKVKKLVKVYSAMRADDVAPLLSALDEDLALRVLYGMKAKKQAELLARMTPERAARIADRIMAVDF
ncbi:hypothetical protein K8I61_06610 [bacterium]|nr:hypothetical protein [bacterium]